MPRKRRNKSKKPKRPGVIVEVAPPKKKKPYGPVVEIAPGKKPKGRPIVEVAPPRKRKTGGVVIKVPPSAQWRHPRESIRGLAPVTSPARKARGVIYRKRPRV